MKVLLSILLLLAVLPTPVWAFVSHEYPAIYTHQLGGFFYLIALSVVLWGILDNGLQKRPGWRFFYYSVICFIAWDAMIIFSRFVEAIHIEPGQIVGDESGWGYFFRMIDIEGFEYLYYAGRFDFILLNGAMLLFYLGLREHLEQAKQRRKIVTSAVLPLLPIILTEMGGNAVFMVLSVMSLIESVKLYKLDRENPLWGYMVWLSASYVMFAFSRSFGHVLKPFLYVSGNQAVWTDLYLEGISGSLNTGVRFLVASLTLFFAWIYKIYLKMARDREQIDIVNYDLTELNQELETLVAERTMALMGLTVADRVRNPAMLIGVACRRLAGKEKKLTDDLEDVLVECRRLETIVGDFESLLKSRRSVFRYEDINEIVKSVVTVLEREASAKGIQFICRIAPHALRVNTQKNLLRAAIYHVIRNAIEATPAKGRIEVSTTGDQQWITLSVSDSGSGIPHEDLERIFDPFYSTKQLRFGMGLPLVKQIITEHLGEIKVASEIGRGTTFRLLLPVRWMEKKQQVPTT